MNKVSYEVFVKEVVKNISNYLPEEYANAEVFIERVVKNNNIQLTALMIRRNENEAVPTIYLEGYYEDYKDGTEFQDILEDIATLRVSHVEVEKLNLERLNFDRCKSNIYPKLINAKMNEEDLQNRPHSLMLDLAIVYKVEFKEPDDESIIGCKVTNELLKMWNISDKDLHNIAIKNLNEQFPGYIMPIEEVFFNMVLETKVNYEEIDWESRCRLAQRKMFILSNSNSTDGATAIMNRELMEKATELIGEELYVIQSDVSEMIVVPQEGHSLDGLIKTLESINNTQVSPSERLSYKIYTYSRKNGFSIAG